jgi:geranylgeranyl reductase family protein
MSARVIVIGAGPGGCAAAIALRRAGFAVLLVDKGSAGRDKVCGDALIPDAFAALEALGCLEAVLAQAHTVPCLRIHAPAHAPVDVRGRLACLPRAQLDAVLLDAAQAHGAEFLPRMEFVGLQEHAGRVCGVRLRNARGRTLQFTGEHVLLATGAAAGPLEAAGMCLRRAPSGVALRAYFELPRSLAEELDVFTISYDRHTCPAYGWIFAGPGRIFNVGVGLFQDALRRPGCNLRELWEGFLASCPAAAQVRRYARQLTPERGAPLRTSLRGARIARSGLLLVGEAMGTTYAMSGEGIGKAMQTGLLAAECLAHAPGHAEAAYAQQLQARFRPQFDAYRIAQGWLSWPLVCKLLAARAQRGSYVRSQLEGLLAETVNPRELLSARGLLRAMWA